MIERLKNKQYIIIMAFFLALGAALVFFSGNSAQSENNGQDEFRVNEEEYEKYLETRLETLIEEIDGAGEVEVMVTLDTSAVYTYAEDMNQDIGSEGNVKRETSIVMSSKSSSVKEAIVSGYTLPRVRGAAVVCEKTLNGKLLEKIINTVSASLGISTDKIYVTN